MKTTRTFAFYLLLAALTIFHKPAAAQNYQTTGIQVSP